MQLSNIEEYLEQIRYFPVDVLKYFNMVKELRNHEKNLEDQLDKYHKQLMTMMTLPPSKEKDKLLSDIKNQAQNAHTQLLALHRERIICVEIILNQIQKYSQQLDGEAERFMDELRVMPKELEVEQVGRKSTREIPRQETLVTRNVQTKSKTQKNQIHKQDLEQEYEDPALTKLYCICQRPSSGTMVACDYPGCKKEWFHLECVGLIEIPSEKQKWYCSECEQKINGLK